MDIGEPRADSYREDTLACPQDPQAIPASDKEGVDRARISKDDNAGRFGVHVRSLRPTYEP
jgi:hypothetical protein